MACLLIPGLCSPGPEHWQNRWEQERSDCRRVDLGDRDDPTRIGWIAALGRAVEQAEGCPVLIAHDLGCLALAWWASIAGVRAAKVTGALLVAPPDAEREDADPRLHRFAPVPLRPMPFPTIVVASRNDPHAAFDRSKELAAGWSARFHDAGDAGHIDETSRLGSWADGQALVAELIGSASSRWRRPLARCG